MKNKILCGVVIILSIILYGVVSLKEETNFSFDEKEKKEEKKEKELKLKIQLLGKYQL